jgi:hypothetical protein
VSPVRCPLVVPAGLVYEDNMKVRSILVGTIMACITQYAPASEDAGNAAAQANNLMGDIGTLTHQDGGARSLMQA